MTEEEQEKEGYDGAGLIAMYARWKRHSALWILGLMAFLVVVTVILTALEQTP